MAKLEANPQRCIHWNRSYPYGRCNLVDPQTNINDRSIPSGIDDFVITFEGQESEGNLFSCKFDGKDVEGQKTCNRYTPTGK
jgi:hypothetical protein